MPVAGGVPCVDSTFFMPVSERKYYMAKNFLTYEQQLHTLEYDKQLAIPDHEYATKKLEELSDYSQDFSNLKTRFLTLSQAVLNMVFRWLQK